MIIAIDFDGTCVTHDYPSVGESIGAEPVLRNLVKNGHKLILYTMRSHDGDDTLQDAIDWFKENDIKLWGVNENPEQSSWTSSPKPYANLYIDDAALGCPKVRNEETGKVYVDWKRIDHWFKQCGVINTVIQ